MLPVLPIVGLSIPTAPLAFLLALFIGTELATRAIGRLATSDSQKAWESAFQGAVWWALLAGLVAARLGYAIRFYSLYAASPQLLLSIRPGTLMLLPGLLVAVAVGILYLTMTKGIPLSVLSDAVAVGLAGALAVFHAGRFLTGEGYGLPTDLPWGIDLWGATRHPVQLYEAAAATLIVVILWRSLRRALSGQTFWRFVALYGAATLFLDAFHVGSATWILGIRIPQVVALVSLVAALYVLSFYARQRAESTGDGLPASDFVSSQVQVHR